MLLHVSLNKLSSGTLLLCFAKVMPIKIVWVLKKKRQRLEAAQMKFLRQLLGITKLDKEKEYKY
jgi:hypothetical protein